MAYGLSYWKVLELILKKKAYLGIPGDIDIYCEEFQKKTGIPITYKEYSFQEYVLTIKTKK